jgi:toxin HigB-1
MIRNIIGKTTQDIFNGYNSRQSRTVPQELHGKARRLLDKINAAPDLVFLNIPPGNHLEKLRGRLTGYWSVRINDQWRIIFKWKENDALDVKIVDYHY